MPGLEWLVRGAIAPLVEMGLKATLILGGALLGLRLLRGASAATRHLVLTAAVAGVLLLPLLTWLLPQWRVAILPVDQTSTAAPTAPSQANRGPSTEVPVPMLGQGRPGGVEGQQHATVSGRVVKAKAHAVPVRQMEAPSAAKAVLLMVRNGTAEAVPLQKTHPGTTTPSAFMIFVLWLVGGLVVALRLARCRLRLWLLLRNAAPVTKFVWRSALDQSVRRLGISRPIALLSSAALDVPVTFGIVYPRVVLPASVEEWSQARRSAVLVHEMAHVRRMDALTQWLADVAGVVYWFHPLIWLAARAMRVERERACDDYVLQCGARPSDYAHDLLEIASALKPVPYAAALAMARRSQLEGRLMAVLDPDINRRPVTRAAAIILVAGALALLVPIAALRAQSKLAPPTASETRAPKGGIEGGVPGGVPGGVKGGVPGGVQGGVPSGVEGGVGDDESALELDGPRMESDAEPAVSAAPAMASAPAAAPAAAAVAGQASTSAVPGVPAVPAVPAVPGTPAAPAPPGSVHSESRGLGEGPWPAGCESGGGTRQNTSRSDSNGRRTWTALWSNSACTLELKAEGEIKFQPDLSSIASISPGGYFEIYLRAGDTLRRVRATPSANGEVQYAYTVGGQAQPFDQQARAWFASLLLTLERHTGFAVETRVPYLLQRGGAEAVLEEAGKLGSDYVCALYLMKLLASAQLNDAQVRRVMQQAGRDIKSDYELGRVLIAVAGKYPLADEGSRIAFVQAADNLKSDYEHARVLIELLKRENLSREAAQMALSSAARIKSDYERARTLMAISSKNLVDVSMQPEYMKALAGINSDYERARVLLDFTSRQKLTPQSAEMALNATSGMNSDYEKARVLIALADANLVSEAMVTAYLETIRSIKSDYERARALVTALNKLPLKDTAVAGLIESAAAIHSDHELARVLVAIAGKFPLSSSARAAYLRAAEQIRGEYERKRALEAIGSSMI